MALFFFFLLLLPPPLLPLFSHWFMSQMQKLFFCSHSGGAVYVRQMKKLRGKIMADNGGASRNAHYTLFRPAWLSCFEICNKLMLLKIFSVSTYIRFGRARKKNEIKTDWLWLEMGLCCARSERQNSLKPNPEWGKSKTTNEKKQCAISRLLVVATSRLAALRLLADWRHLPSGWKWRQWFALRS